MWLSLIIDYSRVEQQAKIILVTRTHTHKSHRRVGRGERVIGFDDRIRGELQADPPGGARGRPGAKNRPAAVDQALGSLRIPTDLGPENLVNM